MFLKNLHILTFVFLLAFQIACGQTQNVSNPNLDNQAEKVDLRLDKLRNQAAKLYKAFDNNNSDEFTELIHPKIIEKFGSKEKFNSMMKNLAKRNSETFESFASSVEKPLQIFEIDEQLFGVVPYKLEGITFEKNKVVTIGSVVGISNDNGENWKFVNGSKFKVLFPNAADQVQIPKDRTFVNDKEQ